MMQALRQLGGGVIIAIVSVILVLGGISLALAETLPPSSAPTQIPPTLPQTIPSPTSTPGIQTPTLLSETPTTTATETMTASSTSALSLPPVVVCTPPTGWIPITITINDTIYSLAQRYNTTPENLSAKNCLASLNLSAGTLLYVPPVPATAKVIPCGPPAGWVKTHVVQAGDNLYRIALSYGITYQQLQAANCMGSSVLIYVGQKLWVPNVPTLTPIPGVTIIPNFPTNTPTVTASYTTVPPTTVPATATSTFIATATVPTATFTQSLTPASISP
jgi:LysM repeat protein